MKGSAESMAVHTAWGFISEGFGASGPHSHLESGAHIYSPTLTFSEMRES